MVEQIGVLVKMDPFKLLRVIRQLLQEQRICAIPTKDAYQQLRMSMEILAQIHTNTSMLLTGVSKVHSLVTEIKNYIMKKEYCFYLRY